MSVAYLLIPRCWLATSLYAILLFLTLKMEALFSSQTLLHVKQITLPHEPDDYNMKSQSVIVLTPIIISVMCLPSKHTKSINNCYLTYCFVWVWNFLFHIKEQQQFGTCEKKVRSYLNFWWIKVRAGWKKLYNERDLYSSQDIIRTMRASRMEWAERAAHQSDTVLWYDHLKTRDHWKALGVDGTIML
jgi:hypothetical protein